MSLLLRIEETSLNGMRWMAADGQSTAEKQKLKDVVRTIILSQGNEFIKELLRKNKIRIGSKKADFYKNILAAIDEGTLTRPMIEEWLSEVEGWGNQHIYLFEPPPLTVDQVRARLAKSCFAKLLGAAVSYAFPEVLELSAITLAQDHLSIAWHKNTGGWERTPSNDFQQVDDDGELYKYNAYRQRFDRAVVRFADAYCAVMVQLPIEGDAHFQVHSLVQRDLQQIGIFEAIPRRILLSEAFKAMTLKQDTVVQSTRMMTDGGHVDVVSTLSEGGIADVQALREARRGVDDKNFTGTDGMFHFLQDQHAGLSRNVKVQGYGLESRIRVWVQCKREDVYHVLDVIWANA